MPDIVVIAHNIRSAHNVGAIFRCADGFGVQEIILSGYSPYPTLQHDSRLPHIHEKLTQMIHKTALGAEQTVRFTYHQQPPLEALSARGYRIVALEQAPGSVLLPTYTTPNKVALLLGEEIAGVDESLLKRCDDCVEIPMCGQKESFNVSVAAGIALYHLTCVGYNKP